MSIKSFQKKDNFFIFLIKSLRGSNSNSGRQIDEKKIIAENDFFLRFRHFYTQWAKKDKKKYQTYRILNRSHKIFHKLIFCFYFQARKGSAEVERNDSGVGSETSKSSRARWQPVRASSTASSTTSSMMSTTSTATVSLEEETTCQGTETSPGDSVGLAANATTIARPVSPEQLLCEDCEQTVETQVTDRSVDFNLDKFYPDQGELF